MIWNRFWRSRLGYFLNTFMTCLNHMSGAPPVTITNNPQIKYSAANVFAERHLTPFRRRRDWTILSMVLP